MPLNRAEDKFNTFLSRAVFASRKLGNTPALADFQMLGELYNSKYLAESQPLPNNDPRGFGQYFFYLASNLDLLSMTSHTSNLKERLTAWSLLFYWTMLTEKGGGINTLYEYISSNVAANTQLDTSDTRDVLKAEIQQISGAVSPDYERSIGLMKDYIIAAQSFTPALMSRSFSLADIPASNSI